MKGLVSASTHRVHSFAAARALSCARALAAVSAVSVAFFASGCAPPAATDATHAALAATTLPPPTLRFDANWGYSASARLVAGGPAIVNYDGSRLGACRAAGKSTDWHLEARWNVDGQYAGSADLTVLLGGGRAAAQDREVAPTTITLPIGHEIEMWFVNYDAECTAWDSNYGANYKFALNGPLLDFNSDWSVTSDGPLIAGQTAVVRYDDSRLQECALANGAQWSIDGWMSLDGAAPIDLQVTQVTNGIRGRVDLPITIPSGSDLAFWFETTNLYGCHAFDSDYGRNFHFAITR